MKWYYLANARMPSEKAYGIQMAKMCEAFIELGIDLTLVVPNRRGPQNSLKDFYNLRVEVPVVRLPTPDFYTGGRLGYAFSSGMFMLVSVFFVLYKRMSARLVIYTIDMDAFSNCLYALLAPTATEVHSSKKSTWMQRLLFSRARVVVATNTPIADSLRQTFSGIEDKLCIEHNGVDEKQFVHVPTKAEARRELSLPAGNIALYVGRFYSWKGLSILNEAAKVLERQSVQLYAVGGSREKFEELFGPTDQALQFVTDVHSTKVPLWLAAADVLLILGTKAGDESYRYTSPMKIYEYAAAKRTIIASDTPALRDALSDQEAFFFEPDNAQDLAGGIIGALSSHEADVKIMRAYQGALEHTWTKRAERITTFMKTHAL